MKNQRDQQPNSTFTFSKFFSKLIKTILIFFSKIDTNIDKFFLVV